MPITQKPKRTPSSQTEGVLPEDVVQSLIHKGGSVAGQQEIALPPAEERPRRAAGRPRKNDSPTLAETSENLIAPVVLRLPTDLLTQIDASIQARPVRVPRHTWLLEAVAEKLEREK